MIRVLPALAAVPLALLLAGTRPTTSLTLIAGAIPLLIAFLSPLAGLYILVFSMLLGPEFLVGSLGTGATMGRGITLRFDDLLLVLVGLAWLARAAVSKEAAAFVRTPLNRTIMLYVAGCVFATLMGVLTGRVRPAGGFFFLLKYYEYFFLYFMTVNLIHTEKQIKHLVTASLLTCLAVSLYAISQIPSGARVSAPFEGEEGEPNTLGGYLVFMMAVISGLLVTRGAVTRRWPLTVLLGICGIALQATLSRASFLGAAVVALGFLVFLRRRSPLLLALLVLSMAATPFLAPRAVTERIVYTFAQPPEEGQIRIGRVRVDTSTSDRLRSWQRSFEVWKQSPLWGHGVTGGPFMDAMYPRVLTETGLLGLCAFLALMWVIFRTGKAGYQQLQDPYLRGIALGFLFGFLGLLIHAIGSNTFIIVRIMEPFWLYAGLVVRSVMLNGVEHQLAVKSDTEQKTPMVEGPARFQFGRTGAPETSGH
ncbi:MAG: O-antigen ligase family protein [Nitrospirota bacterium]